MTPDPPPPLPHLPQKKAQIAALTAAVEEHSAKAETAKKQLAKTQKKDSAARKLGGSLAEAAKLGNRKRGEEVLVVAKGKYNTSGYTFDDVTRLCSAVAEGGIKLAWLRPEHDMHDPATMNVPYGTIKRWGTDDDTILRRSQQRGVLGEPHWKVERDVRRRTSLDSGGGYNGTGEPMLGKAEEGMMVWMADQAKRGTPATRLDAEGVLRDAAITLGCKISTTGQSYTINTDVRKMTDAFLIRCKERGVPFVEKKGQGLSLQRAQAASIGTVKEFKAMVRGVGKGNSAV